MTTVTPTQSRKTVDTTDINYVWDKHTTVKCLVFVCTYMSMCTLIRNEQVCQPEIDALFIQYL